MTDNNSKYCLYCMSELSSDGKCLNCNFNGENYCPAPHHLQPGTILLNRYLVGRVLGEGGFGITYIGRDLKLDLKVAIKEYYPVSYCNRMAWSTESVTVFTGNDKDFNHGMQNFKSEAKAMAKMDKQQEVVGVKEFFECNNTAYIIMEYVEGVTFKEIVERNGPFKPNDLFSIIEPLFMALERFHGYGLIHRDISPNNLMLENGKVRLLDFGCARETGNEKKQKTMTVYATGGYTPLEQHQTKGKQGPWTDVYSLCATIYYCLTGKSPSSVFDRLDEDDLVPPRKLGVNISEQTEKALLEGLTISVPKRTQSMAELYDSLYGSDASDRVITDDSNTIKSNLADNKVTDSDGNDSCKEDKGNSEQSKAKVWGNEIRQGDSLSENKNDESRKFERTMLIIGRGQKAEVDSEFVTDDGTASINKDSDSAPKIPEYLKKMTELHSSAQEEVISQSSETEEESKKNITDRRKKIPFIVGFGIAGVVAVASLIFFIFTTSVPDIANLKFEDAKTQLAKASLKVGDVEYQDSESISRDSIISFEPKGKRVFKNRKVSMIVSSGCMHDVPDLTKKSQAEAEAILTEYNYSLNLTTKYSNDVAEGIVMQQDPLSGTELHEGEEVSLVVSAGPKPFALKNYVGEKQSTATKKIKKLGLKVKIKKSKSKTKPKGEVIKQNPKTGSKVRKGDTITLTVSKGVQVPDLYKMSKANAKKALKKAGLKLGNVDSDFSSTVQKGHVISQKVKKGKYVNPKSNVDIVISAGPGVKVPDVTGESLSQAKSDLQDKGLDYSVSYDVTYNSGNDGKVESQSKNPGDVVKKGTTVYLTVYQYQSNNSGNQGNYSGNQSNNSGNQSNNSGNQSNNSGNQSNNSGNQSNNSGNKSNNSGNKTNNSGNQSNNSGNKTNKSDNASGGSEDFMED